MSHVPGLLEGVARWHGRDPSARTALVFLRGGVVSVTAGLRPGLDCHTARFVGPVPPAGVEAAIDLTLAEAVPASRTFGARTLAPEAPCTDRSAC